MRRVLTIGHRGAAGHAPENTITAIQKGIDLGADLVEIDVRRTADDALVVLHDETLDRTTNGKGRLDRWPLREIKKLKTAGGETVPTLEEALNATAGKTGLMLELKVRGTARQAVEAVRDAGFTAPVIYASFLRDELTDVRTADPTASLLLLFARLPRDPVARAIQCGASSVGLRHDRAGRRLIEACHQAGLLVFVYTADDPRDIQRARTAGADGVISNYPERVVRP